MLSLIIVMSSLKGSILNIFPPDLGSKLSNSVTSAPLSTYFNARLLPMKPSPPKIRTFSFILYSYLIENHKKIESCFARGLPFID